MKVEGGFTKFNIVQIAIAIVIGMVAFLYTTLILGVIGWLASEQIALSKLAREDQIKITRNSDDISKLTAEVKKLAESFVDRNYFELKFTQLIDKMDSQEKDENLFRQRIWDQFNEFRDEVYPYLGNKKGK